jgi:hypothetical protein
MTKDDLEDDSCRLLKLGQMAEAEFLIHLEGLEG